MKRLVVALLFAGILAGCAPWSPTGGLYKSDKDLYSVDLPQGWMRSDMGKGFLMTRDGLVLQHIQIQRYDLKEGLKNTKKKLNKEMLPHEVAEVALDDFASIPDVHNFEVQENTPAEIGGVSGFRVVYNWKTKDGLRVRSVQYGFISGEWFYSLRYDAARRYYFEKDRDAFEKVVQSFKLIKEN
jgi:hypothetical protein